MEEENPNPDEILKQIYQEENSRNKGKLKIFFGMSAGVGKTYGMLEFAHSMQKAGRDVVIGCIETHGRKDTQELVAGIEMVPQKKIEYKGYTFDELDVDAIIQRNPEIVLIDELAHTNIPGSRNNKRYQDVEEILEKGINVYSTINVQHIESRAETVHEITGIRINERVPDSIIENADEIELIDISPSELQKRLADGKVYMPENSKIAMQNFFRKGNLHALRELSLRMLAERVDMDMLDYMQQNKITAAWKVGEKLMVAVGPSPYSEKLIRWTRRMAFTLGAQWIAVNINTGRELSKEQAAKLKSNLELAKELGAKIIHTIDKDIISGLIRVGQQNNVAQIIIGRTQESYLKKLFSSGSLIDKLTSKSGNIDIYVINTLTETEDTSFLSKILYKIKPSSSLKAYLTSLIALVISTSIFIMIKDIVGYQSIGLLYLSVTAILSLFLGKGPIISYAIAGSMIWDFFFIHPIMTLSIFNIHDIITLVTNLTIALIISYLINKIKIREIILSRSQNNISELFSFLELMNNAHSIKDVVIKADMFLNRNYEANLVLYLKDKVENKLHKRAFGDASLYNTKEFAVANWCFDNRKNAGKSTNTLPNSDLKYYPLITSDRIVGVAGIKFKDIALLPPDKLDIINSLITQLSNTLIREINIDIVKASLEK